MMDVMGFLLSVLLLAAGTVGLWLLGYFAWYGTMPDMPLVLRAGSASALVWFVFVLIAVTV